MIVRRWVWLFGGLCVAALAQETSVKPGINKGFVDPDVAEFIERFEDDDREIYAHREEIVENLDLQPQWHVADIGAGTGFITRMIASKVPQGKVYAVEIAENFLKHIDSTSKEQGLENVVTVLGAEKATNLPESSLDLAFVCDTFHHFEFPQDYSKDIHRVLKPGGHLVVVDFIKEEGSRQWVLDHVHFDQEQVKQLLDEVGFEFVGESKFMVEQYMLTFRKK